MNTKRKKTLWGEKEQLFRLTTNLFYYPKASQGELRQLMGCSLSTLKRMLRLLRQYGVLLTNRLGRHVLDLPHLKKPPIEAHPAIIAAETDLHILKPTYENWLEGFHPENKLVDKLCNILPQQGRFKGKILIERGYICMGDPDLAVLLIVYGLNEDIVNDLVRYFIETEDGIRKSRTHGIAYTSETPHTLENLQKNDKK